MEERDRLIQLLIKEKGGTPEDYFRVMDTIAYHESNHTMRSDIHQMDGGPGRGKYQFEKGKDAEGITAAKRTKRYYKANNIPIPEWLEKATQGKSLDVSHLTSAQQDILFLANMREHPKADFSKLWDGKETIPEFWAKYHWKGKSTDLNNRLKSFKSSMEGYNAKGEDVIRKMALEMDNSGVNPYPSEQYNNEGDNTEFDKIVNMAVNPYQNTTDLNSLLDYVRGQQQQVQPQPQQQPQQFPQRPEYYNKELTRFNGGGTHETNPLGGIPLGEGKSVESDETKFKLPQGNFIFSDRIDTSGNIQPKLDGSKQQVSNSYNNQFADGGYTNIISPLNLNKMKKKTSSKKK